mmetsp:Transcript_60170/g.99355  ORF Transcript_60170/g.99355 Transcript_60170/m.99355 type:complete len:276 (+) Transcript_60170:289-1116(+)
MSGAIDILQLIVACTLCVELCRISVHASAVGASIVLKSVVALFSFVRPVPIAESTTHDQQHNDDNHSHHHAGIVAIAFSALQHNLVACARREYAQIDAIWIAHRAFTSATRFDIRRQYGATSVLARACAVVINRSAYIELATNVPHVDKLLVVRLIAAIVVGICVRNVLARAQQFALLDGSLAKAVSAQVAVPHFANASSARCDTVATFILVLDHLEHSGVVEVLFADQRRRVVRCVVDAHADGVRRSLVWLANLDPWTLRRRLLHSHGKCPYRQ